MTAPAVQQDLDAVECLNPQCPGGHPVGIYPQCHPGSAVVAMYDRNRGVLLLVCHECGKTVLELAIAKATIQ